MRATRLQLENTIGFINRLHGLEEGRTEQFFVLEAYNSYWRLALNVNAKGVTTNFTLLMPKRELATVLDGIVQMAAFTKQNKLVAL